MQSYLAFGDDEETLNLGAKAISDHLEAQGVTLEFSLDEGGGKIEPGAAFGAPDIAIAHVDLMEKGYADRELSVRSIGGHSSRPYGGTSLEHLACALADITHKPFPVRLSPVMMGAFETLAPYITAEPLKTLVRDVPANADAIAAYCFRDRTLFPFVTTTIAPTIIRGSSKVCNVMPQDMQAVINFRLAEPQEAATGVHGTNERILVRAYLQGIRVLIDLMEHVNYPANVLRRVCVYKTALQKLNE